jgi:glycosyltransferase involved in cell wall biosynthesis
MNKPKVSIVCLTYNHQEIISHALDSMLSQQCEFDFEIVVHDDASTDGTQEVLKHYKEVHTDKMKLILQSENQHSKRVPVFDLVLPHCDGEYVACCDGDDYWCDNHKLQKQASYLDEHPDVFISGHDMKVVDSEGQLIQSSKLLDIHKRDFSADEIKKGLAWLLTSTWMFRNRSFPQAIERGKVINGDTFLLSLLGEHGASHYHDDINPAVYRIHDSGLWSTMPKSDRKLSELITSFWRQKYFARKNDLGLASYHKNKLYKQMAMASPTGNLIKELLIRITFFRQIRSVFNS